MSEVLNGRTWSRPITRYMIVYITLGTVVEVTLFATGLSATGTGVLVSQFLVCLFALWIIRNMRTRGLKGSRPGGMSIMAATIAMPGTVIIFVGNVIGDDIIRNFCTTIGSSYIGGAGLIVAMSRTLPAS